jgi:hypothetical protein
MRPNLRKSDGTYWVSSYNPYLPPMIGLIDRTKAYYFIRLEKRWFGWSKTDDVLETGPDFPRDYEVVPT